MIGFKVTNDKNGRHFSVVWNHPPDEEVEYREGVSVNAGRGRVSPLYVFKNLLDAVKFVQCDMFGLDAIKSSIWLCDYKPWNPDALDDTYKTDIPAGTDFAHSVELCHKLYDGRDLREPFNYVYTPQIKCKVSVGFKVVRVKAGKLYSAAWDLTAETKYPPYSHVVPKPNAGPLAVFKHLRGAVRFVQLGVNRALHPMYRIYLCEYKPSEHQKFWDGKRECSQALPDGTDFADSVKLRCLLYNGAEL